MLVIQDLSHAYGRKTVLSNVSLTVEATETVCILGASGCGKTTLLRLVAGLEKTQRGCILLDGQVVSGVRGMVPPEKRRIGMMFQDYALFPHRTVLENVLFGMPSGHDRRQRAMELLDGVHLADRRDCYPHQLSGGQQQRVALVRSIAANPRLLLLDEPFNGLDPCLRDSVREHTRMLCASQRIPVMLVTHDPREALGLADTVVILRDGAVVQSASPAEIRRNPASAYVLTFLEQQLNTYSGYIRDRQAYTPFGLIPAPANDDCPARVYVRPDAFSLTTDAAALAGTLRSCRFADDRHFLEVELDGQPGGSLVTIQAPRDFAAPKDALVRFRIDPEQIFVFPV